MKKIFILTLFIISSTFGQAQPWMDCDTIRAILIHHNRTQRDFDLKRDSLFQISLDNVSQQTGVPIISLGTIFLAGDEVLIGDENTFMSTFLKLDPDLIPGKLGDTLDFILQNFYPDVIFGEFMNPIIFSASNAIFPRATIMSSSFLRSPQAYEKQAVYVGHGMGHAVDLAHNDTTVNIMNDYLINNFSNLNFTDHDIQQFQNNYRPRLLSQRPNFDCDMVNTSPAPFADQIEIKVLPDQIVVNHVHQLMNYWLTDIAGRRLKTGPVDQHLQVIDTGELHPGIYFFSLTDGQQIRTIKFFK